MTHSKSWQELDDEALLKVRIRDLDLKIEGSGLEELIAIVMSELDAKKIAIRPRVYLGDEWFSPDGEVAVSVPFYLAHPRLKALELRQVLEVEGGEPEHFLKLLRHEVGHCLDHAYHFSRRRKWKEVFGSPELEYQPDTYKPRPYSRSFVRHLDNWYAQAHPDEDFAETFAVWLSPGIDWRREYRGWARALQKLEYMDELMTEVVSKRAPKFSSRAYYLASKSARTLGAYYQRRRKEGASDHPEVHDVNLAMIFSGDRSLPERSHSAHRFLTRERTVLVDTVSRFSGARKVTVELFIRKLGQRCDARGLRVAKETEAETRARLFSYVAAAVTTYLFTGKFKRTV